MKPSPCPLALALALLASAVPAQATNAPRLAANGASQSARGGVDCPAASAPRRPGTATSKLRHVPDEADPCADSHGAARPVRSPASAPAA